jgi:hypothetical protein
MRPKTFLAVGATVALVAGVFAWREYHREAKGAADLQTAHTASASELLQAFMADEAAATARFVGTSEQAIVVEGVIRAADANGPGWNVVLETGDDMAGVVCEFAALPEGWKAGDAVKVKGICQGYTGEGMLPGDVVLQRCAAAE